jgi:hypothetical protein
MELYQIHPCQLLPKLLLKTEKSINISLLVITQIDCGYFRLGEKLFDPSVCCTGNTFVGLLQH